MSKPRFQFFSAAYLIISQDNKILLIRRFNTGWQDGMYDLPAGHLEGNETVEDAVIREAKEEVDLDIDPGSLKIVHVLHRNSGEREYFDFFLESKDWKGSPKINELDKHDDLAWFDLDNIPENTISHIRTVIDHWRGGKVFSNVGF